MKHWVKAFRLRTLPLALASIGMGAFLAASAGQFKGGIFGLCALTTILLQVLSNLANDYGDSVHGADGHKRTGPSRAVQSGVISLKAMRNAIILFSALSLLSGVGLIYLAFGWSPEVFGFFLGLGVLAILAAITYTAGYKPYGYMGLGDISVLIFFGLVGVMGSAYLYEQELKWEYLLPAISTGLFSVGVLNVNNIRDIESDKEAGKISIPVRIGRKKAVIYHWFLLGTGFALGLTYVLMNYTSYWQLIIVLALPGLIKNAKAVKQHTEASKLDPFLKQMALTTLLYVVLFGVGQLVG
ncbi:1,4-dihydroxy-2-naphthoate polyprenyltransferase [Roseivirga echinicomitans]|uniref:1,4-dihydroxy-2-naphthoate octaprenyltransferase n=1 Tax=Roseivirga echinicomitans TaxID=296218 RepID=A0A150XCX0_9BACT|nr:1,4-dihydroxy-2-naphthoate polyprenyltransferase [Roseivirga echinicomitans]KYG76558.1 1,4-dihydroxy-2-naphthoate octaprenyltransferase [Roseivirga echinicomitans]